MKEKGSEGKQENPTRKKEGFILLTSYMLLAALSVFSLGLIAQSSVFMQANERNLNKINAFQFAESGLDAAIVNLKTNLNYTGTNYVALGNRGGYQVTVTTPDPSKPLTRQITATGFAPANDATTRAYETRQIVAYAALTPVTPFDQAIFSSNQIDMSGFALVDSYNSQLGPYNALTANSNGDLVTNSTGAGSVHLQGGELTYKGDITVGPGSDPDQVVSKSGNVTVTGTISAASSPLTFKSPTNPSGVGSSGVLSLSGTSVYTIQSGSYVYDSIDIKGNAVLVVTGPVKLYVKGNFDISGQGNVSVSTTKPSDLVVSMTGAGAVNFSSNSLQFYGALYAPDSNVQLSNSATMHGAVVADSFKQSGHTEFHYDESLADVSAGDELELEILSWQEKNTTAGS